MKPVLVQFIEQGGLDETKVMNMLQERGICSDECVTASDVADGWKCITWLKTKNLSGMKNNQS